VLGNNRSIIERGEIGKEQFKTKARGRNRGEYTPGSSRSALHLESNTVCSGTRQRNELATGA
jgi:hypothetical protein